MGWLSKLKTLLRISEAVADVAIKNPEKKAIYEGVKDIINPIALPEKKEEKK